jgi:hypothetical protein
MSAVATRLPAHKHIPLIKFLGPRHLLPHNPSPSSSSSSSFPSPTSAAAGPQSVSAPPQVVKKGGINVVYYDNIKQLPRSFRTKALSEAEMAMIDVSI